MSKLVRLTLYVLLCALFVSLGDGPFLDEVLAEQSQQQQIVADSSTGSSDAVPASRVQIYHTLMNFVGAGESPSFTSTPVRFDEIPFVHHALTFQFVAPLDKPPRSFA